jgi:hypothetical protein
MPQSHISSIKPGESAKYTYDMLESLRKIALQQRQAMLAHLLNLAAMEAKAQSSQAADQDTALPG